MGNGIEQFVTDRNRAMRSLSELSIREFAANYRIVMPSDSETFWGEVHRVRCHIRTFTEEEQESSRAWLSEHGMDGRPPEVGLFPGG